MKAISDVLVSRCRRLRHKLSRAHISFQDKRRARCGAKANNKNLNAIFVWIPKSAGTSLWDQVASASAQKLTRLDAITVSNPNCGICTFGHISLAKLVESGYLDANYFESAWKFSVVRNPFDRAVSLFEYLRGRGNLPPTTTFSIFCHYLSERAYEPIGLYNHVHLSQLNPQVSWLRDANGNLFPDFIGRYENLEQDARVIFSKLGIAFQNLPHLNSSARKPLSEYYGARELDIVRDVYSEDFNAFDYDPNPRI